MKGKDMIVSQAIEKMIAFYKGNIHDIDHFIRVWAYARTIAELENVENFMVAWGTDYQRKNG